MATRPLTTPTYLRIPDSIRPYHAYLIGAWGYGKTTLLHNLILQDALQKKGIAVIDPEGDFAEALLDTMPKSRVPDVLYFSKQTPIPISVLDAKSAEERDDLAEDMLVTFRRLSEGWGERMDAILRYAIPTLTHIPDATFLDLYKLLKSEKYRSGLPRLPNYLYVFWKYEYRKNYERHIQPIITRLIKFLTSPFLRAILGNPGRLNLSQAMQEGKILIFNLGGFGYDNARWIGSIIVSRLQIAMKRRSNIPPSQRVPFYIYIDEFHDFVNTPLHLMLPRARKYRMCFTLAHQFSSQLDEKTKDTVLGCGTVIAFNVQPKDASFLRLTLQPFTPEDLVSTPRYYAICRVLTRVKAVKLLPPPRAVRSYRDEILAQSRQYVSKPPEEHVEFEEDAHRKGPRPVPPD